MRIMVQPVVSGLAQLMSSVVVSIQEATLTRIFDEMTGAGRPFLF